MRDGPPRPTPYDRPDASLPDGRELGDLPSRVVTAYDAETNELLNYTFSTPSFAAIDLGFGNKYYNVTRHINKGVSFMLLLLRCASWSIFHTMTTS